MVVDLMLPFISVQSGQKRYVPRYRQTNRQLPRRYRLKEGLGVLHRKEGSQIQGTFGKQ